VGILRSDCFGPSARGPRMRSRRAVLFARAAAHLGEGLGPGWRKPPRHDVGRLQEFRKESGGLLRDLYPCYCPEALMAGRNQGKRKPRPKMGEQRARGCRGAVGVITLVSTVDAHSFEARSVTLGGCSGRKVKMEVPPELAGKPGTSVPQVELGNTRHCVPHD
jgi:hypothetical protein